MTNSHETYLQLFEKDGSWINRPDYMLLSVMSVPDAASVLHTYATMLLEDTINPSRLDEKLSDFGQMAKKKVLERYVQRRVLAGEVVIELARIAAFTGRPPTVNAARRLVAFRQERFIGRSGAEAIKREVERSFTQFLPTAHLQAAMVQEPSLFAEIEGSQTATEKFLGVARAFEQFVDANVVSKSFKWSPLRVPSQIDALNIVKFERLSEQEVRAANLI